MNIIKYNNTKYYFKMAKDMLNDIINDNKTNEELKNYIKFNYTKILN